MKSILYRLYGKKIPLTRPAPREHEYQKINRKIKDEERYLFDKLSKDDWKRFNDLIDLLTQASGINKAIYFQMDSD